jgi:HEAT repeat protein
MNTHRENTRHTNPENYPPELADIIRNLYGNKTIRRKGARRKLEIHGLKNPRSLVALLNSPDQKIRWESLKALIALENRSLIPVFLDLLTDDYGDMRWMSAEGLIMIGRDSIAPTIGKIIEEDDSIILREGVHHVLSQLIMENERELFYPLLSALGNTYVLGPRVKMYAVEILKKLRD